LGFVLREEEKETKRKRKRKKKERDNAAPSNIQLFTENTGESISVYFNLGIMYLVYLYP
jgi:hypothetical protein